MTEQGKWVSTLRTIIQQMESSNVTELELGQGDLKLRLRRDPRFRTLSPVQMAAGDGVAHPQEEFHPVVAPLTGIYYAAPSPTSPPYVAPGDWVEPDAVVGLVETMKVFNEVAADCRGRVVRLVAQPGQLIHAGDPILLVDASVSSDHSHEVAQ